MKASERLLERIRAAGLDIPSDATIKRVYPSSASRNLGAWSWTVADADGIPLHRNFAGLMMAIGSQWTVSELLRTGFELGRDQFGDISLDPPASTLRRKDRDERDSAPRSDQGQ